MSWGDFHQIFRWFCLCDFWSWLFEIKIKEAIFGGMNCWSDRKTCCLRRLESILDTLIRPKTYLYWRLFLGRTNCKKCLIYTCLDFILFSFVFKRSILVLRLRSSRRTINKLSCWALRRILIHRWTDYTLLLQFQESWHWFLGILGWPQAICISISHIYLTYEVISKENLVWLLARKFLMRSTFRSPVKESRSKTFKLLWLQLSAQILIKTRFFVRRVISSFNFIYQRLYCIQFTMIRPHALPNAIFLSGVFIKECINFRKSNRFLRLCPFKTLSMRKSTHYRKLHVL